MTNPAVMGILNVTPDSFSDGGLHTDPVSAALAMIEAGADIIDVGGESTRPGADPVQVGEEMRRVLPVVAALARNGVCVCIDTRNSLTMRSAVMDGAQIVNDVSALRHDPHSARVLARLSCRVVLMHMRGNPKTMMQHALYHDVVADVRAELSERVAYAEAAGIAPGRITIDPGFGFAKTPSHSLALLHGLPSLATLGLPILVGVSRKSFIGGITGEPNARRRLGGSLAAALFAASQGAAILRVHDVAETVQALQVWQALGACAMENEPMEAASAS